MWSTRLISDGGLTRTDQGYDVDIRLPWYRSLPLSVLRGVNLIVDGKSVPDEAIELKVNGKPFKLDALEDLTDEWWHVLDSGVLSVGHAHLEPHSEHKVDLTLTFEIPYVAGAVVPSNCVKTLIAA